MARSTPRRNFLEPTLTPVEAKKVLTLLSQRGKTFSQNLPESVFDTWCNQCNEELANAFGANSAYRQQFRRAGREGLAITESRSEDWYTRRRYSELIEKIKTLDSLIAEVLEFKILTSPAEVVPTASTMPDPVTVVTKTGRRGPLKNADVFIVHGHDETAKAKVAQVIHKLGHNPVILHEQPDMGQAIIDKLIKHATGAAFAVVLLTPDDIGASKKEPDKLRPRARQNVIFELGLFVGVIGKEKVCPLYVKGVEMLTDFSGVGYTLMEDSNEAWSHKLAKEMRAAGLDADSNKL
jgi:predicted nucleotide-binding protein